MEFRLSKEYIHKRKSTRILALALYVIVASIFVFGAYSKDGGYGLFFLCMAIAVGVFFILQNFRQYRIWRHVGENVAFQVNSDHLLAINNGVENKIHIDAIEHVRLQIKKGKVRTIVFKLETGDIGRLQGFDNMQLLAEEIRCLVGIDKVYVG